MIKDFKLKRGLTLVELLVVISILVIMVGIVAGTLNPIALVNKAKDSRRKNDLKEIKIAFEEFFTDKGRYPSAVEVNGWNIVDNCFKIIPEMKSYLKTLPCDPNKKPYEIVIIDENTFKVITNLENRSDNDIPVNWYLSDTYLNYRDRKDEINYGVSSSNILWYEYAGYDPTCGRDCVKLIIGTPWINVVNGVCISGGDTYCFMGRPQGTILGEPIPGVPSDEKQCYVPNCCAGTGCD